MHLSLRYHFMLALSMTICVAKSVQHANRAELKQHGVNV